LNESYWRDQQSVLGCTSKTAKKLCQTQHPEIIEMLDLWVLKAMGNGILLTGDTLCEK